MSTILQRPGQAPEPTPPPAPHTVLVPATRQVFVDDTGRRRRRVRRWGAAIGAAGVLYLAAVAGALGDTSVRPPVTVPADTGNGQVAGLQQGTEVPGLLAEQPSATAAARPARSTATAARAKAATPTSRPAGSATTTPTPTPPGSTAPTTTPKAGSTTTSGSAATSTKSPTKNPTTTGTSASRTSSAGTAGTAGTS